MANGQTTPKLMGHLRPQAMSSAQPFKGVQVANHEPYKWSHLWFRVNILSTELSSMLGSGVCSMSSNWDIVSPSFSCWSQSFPQKMSQVLCSKVQQPSPPVFFIYGALFLNVLDQRPRSNNTVVSNHFHSVNFFLFSSTRSRDFDGM